MGLVVETGEAHEVHHLAVLGGYGAEGINPYLVFETIITQLDWPLGSALSLVLLVVLGSVVMLYSRFAGIGQLAKSFR